MFTSPKILSIYLSIVAFMVMLAYGFFTDPKKVPSPLLGKAAPDFQVTDLHSGKGLQFSSLKGKPVVLNFWASWCVECQTEARVLEAAYQKFEIQTQQAHILGVAIQDSPENALNFAKHFGKTYFLGLDSEDGKIALDYGIYGVPETFFIDSQGIVQYKHIGGVTDTLISEHLEKMLKEPSALTKHD